MPQPTQTPPHDDKLERRLLCGLMSDQNTLFYAQKHIGTDDFYAPLHQSTYDAIRTLSDESVEVDSFVLSRALMNEGVFDDTNEALEFTTGLDMEYVTGANVEWLARKLADLSQRRQLLLVAMEIETHAPAMASSVGAIITAIQENVTSIAVAGGHVGAISADYMEKVMNRTEGLETTGDSGIVTGFADIDRNLGELGHGSVVVIAARPSVGKTTMLLNILSHIAFNLHEECGLLSVEMPPLSLWYNLLGAAAGVSPHKMRTRDVSASEIENLHAVKERLDANKLHVEDCAGFNIDQIRAKGEFLRVHNKVKLLGIDYIQLITGGSKKENENTLQRVTRISQVIKNMAGAMGIPVIAVSQLNRASERDNRRPRLGELRESGSLEQDADVVLLLSRNADKGGEINVCIAKNRNGPGGDVTLHWNPELMRFGNFEHGYGRKGESDV